MMADMKFNEYQQFTLSTAKYEEAVSMFVDSLEIPDVSKRARLSILLKTVYTVLGLCGEAGEIANKLKKVVRDNECYLGPDKRLELSKENGDVLWYNSELFRMLGVNFATGAKENTDKLQSRKERNVIGGSGDSR